MAVLVVHCGAHSTEEVLDGAERALAAGLQVLRQGGAALDAVLGGGGSPSSKMING